VSPWGVRAPVRGCGVSGPDVVCPQCVHGVSLVQCDPCCSLLAESGLVGERLWVFADVQCLLGDTF
jgi:hypothetical protein